MKNYHLEFILNAYNTEIKAIKNALTEFVADIEINETKNENNSSDYKIHLKAEDPTVIFDLCSQFGRIKSVRIEEP